jgi:hypothetical protein
MGSRLGELFFYYFINGGGQPDRLGKQSINRDLMFQAGGLPASGKLFCPPQKML